MMPEAKNWRVRLGDGSPAKVAAVVLSSVAAGLLGVLLLHNFLFFVIGFFVIAASTSEVWFGVRYRLDTEGATVRTGPSVSAIRWSDVRRLIVNDVGVTLSPLESDSRLSAFRGVFLRAGEMGTVKLIELITEFGGENVRNLV
jgi:hypothetical protein